MKKHLFFFAVCFLLAFPAFAQTAAEIERLLNTGSVSYEQAAWFVLRAADVEVFSPMRAFSQAAEWKWLPGKAGPADRAALDGISLLVMQAFNLKGGFFYSIAKNPHYAYRELVYRDIIRGRTDPDMAVSGDLLLFIVGEVLSAREGD